MNAPSRLAILLLLALPSLDSCAAVNPGAVEDVVRAQEAAWNRGDLEGYMSAGYLKSPELTFFSGGDVTRGYETVLERYRKRYREGGREMGTLVFGELETIEYGPDTALVRGRWRLEFETQPSVGGLFTLVLKRTPEGWRIVHDHTSVAEGS